MMPDEKWKPTFDNSIPVSKILTKIKFDLIYHIFTDPDQNKKLAHKFEQQGIVSGDEIRNVLNPVREKPSEWACKFVELIKRKADILGCIWRLCDPETSAVEDYSNKIREVLLKHGAKFPTSKPLVEGIVCKRSKLIQGYPSLSEKMQRHRILCIFGTLFIISTALLASQVLQHLLQQNKSVQYSLEISVRVNVSASYSTIGASAASPQIEAVRNSTVCKASKRTTTVVKTIDAKRVYNERRISRESTNSAGNSNNRQLPISSDKSSNNDKLYHIVEKVSQVVPITNIVVRTWKLSLYIKTCQPPPSEYLTVSPYIACVNVAMLVPENCKKLATLTINECDFIGIVSNSLTFGITDWLLAPLAASAKLL